MPYGERKKKYINILLKLKLKGLKTIKQITKKESLAIRNKFPNVHITIVNRQSSHKRYWCEENRAAMVYLTKMRTGGKRV